jgi:hypothetical protein
MPPVTRSSYQYTSLEDLPSDTIRLLTLSPGNSEESIVCNLANASLSDEPEFAALSYEWGPIDHRHEITLGGKRFGIRENLQQCLLHLRHPRLSICLWIDAICVNQEDLVERGQQVALMSGIYSNAMLVVAWLGAEPAPCYDWLTNILNWQTARWSTESFVDSHKSSSTVQALTRTVPLNDSSAADALLQQQWAHLAIMKTCLEKFGSEQEDLTLRFEAWTFVLDLAFRSYWSRLWIMQEVLLTKNLLLCFCGRNIPATSFRDLLIASFHVRKEGKYNDDTSTTLLRHKWDANGSVHEVGHNTPANMVIDRMHVSADLALQRFRLPDIMATHGYRKCTDVRDHVYALLSLASDCDELVPDYTISCADLFWRTLRANTEEFMSYQILSLMEALQLRAAVIRADSTAERSRAGVCSVEVSQWATVSHVLFTRSFPQALIGDHYELQYHSLVLLSDQRTEAEPQLALVISRTPVTVRDLVFGIDDVPIYLVFQGQGIDFVTKGRAFPTSRRASGYGLPSTLDKAGYGLPRAVVDVSRVVRAEVTRGFPMSEVLRTGSFFHIQADRSLILEICDFYDWLDHR